MSSRTNSNRIIRGLVKLVLGSLLFVATAVALLHLPVVQRQVTRTVAARLSAKLNTSVEIRSIRFALPGTVSVDDLIVHDPDRHPILSVRRFSLETNVMDLLRGRFDIDELRLEGATGQLARRGDTTNIDFILRAFMPATTKNPSLRPVTLNVKHIVLRDIEFLYASEAEELDIEARVDSLVVFGGTLALNPAFIKTGHIDVIRGELSILTSARAKASEPGTQVSEIRSFLPDLGMGIDIASLSLKDCRYAHHAGEQRNAEGFDPDHLTLEGIGLLITDIVLGEDLWAASIRSVTARTPGFTLDELRADAQISKNSATLSGMEIRSGENELCAEVIGRLDRPGALPDLEVHVQGQVIPAALLGFVPDAVQPYLRYDQLTYLTLDGDLVRGTGHIRTLDLHTAASRMQTSGTVTGIVGAASIGWQDMRILLQLGEDVRPLLAPALAGVKLPPDVNVRLGTSGDPGSFHVDALATTAWGAVKAKGTVRPEGKDIGLDVVLSGQDVRLEKWLGSYGMGPASFSATIRGTAGRHQDLRISGQVDEIVLLDRSVRDIALSGWLGPDSLFARTVIHDPDYGATFTGGISFGGPLHISGTASLDSFNAGKLLRLDSVLLLSGDLATDLVMAGDSLAGWLTGKRMEVQSGVVMYAVDSLRLRTTLSPSSSMVAYTAPDAQVRLNGNFDLREAMRILPAWTWWMLNPDETDQPPGGTRQLEGSVHLADGSLLALLGLSLEEFSALDIAGHWDEKTQELDLRAASGRMAGHGLSLDTLHAGLAISRDTAYASGFARRLQYAERSLGDLQFHLASDRDTVVSQFTLIRDTLVLLGLSLNILPTDSGALIYPLQVQALGQPYKTDRKHPVALEHGKIVLRDFNLGREKMNLRLDGDAEALEANLEHLDLTLLNPLFFPDSAVIRKGNLWGTVSYVRGERLDLRANIDSLYLHDSIPLALSLVAETKDQQVPFHLRLTGDGNEVDAQGAYNLRTDSLDAALTLDIANPKMVAGLLGNVVEDVHGAIQGKAHVLGRVDHPRIDGYIRFIDAGMTTVRPRLTFQVPEDTITFNDTMVWMDGFTVLDGRGHPLTLSGKLTTPDYKTYAYALRIDADDYALIDIPDPGATPVRGLLALATAINVSGNEKDTYIQADIEVRDTTALTFVAAQEEFEMIKTEGIVEFVDPAHWRDTTAATQPQTYYDSIVASLPVFNLEARLRIDPGASLKIITNAQSGDYLEASGSADLDLAIDRSGNASLAGDYTVSNGTYRVSFYDLVRKDFTIVPGSRISWNGSPDNGDLDVRAVHTVTSNSLGLIGHEIGENEQAIYKRALDYEVGITIQGTLEKPVVSFTLDLPEVDRTNYPVLANKLDRLKLPEFQSELNKQVFGLLVIGGFLPESSGSDISEGVVAATAISNSVNALLASQLNRLAGQHIKGVSIDVGIQSYSDYSAPGGKTQTAMDFRVTKTIFNDRLSIEVGGDFDLNTDQSGAYKGDSYRGDMAIIYDLTGNGDKKLKMFNNETYDIVYQEIRNTGISLIFIREFNKGDKPARKRK